MDAIASDGPKVILLTQGNDCNICDLTSSFEKAGIQAQMMIDMSDFWNLIEKSPSSKVVLIVDLLSTMSKYDDASGYEGFLRRYAAFRRNRNVRLVVIRPSAEEMASPMIGYGSLVSAYLSPSTPSVDMMTVITAVIAELEPTMNSPASPP